MKPTVLILAAGMASRYGSMKQVEGFGPAGETIMDYSIYDAIRAGFGKVVFIIRKEFADSFKLMFGNRLAGKIEVDYVFQELDYYIEGMAVPAERTKPWGTGHAMLCANETVAVPFAVINADDFYGRDAFIKAADFLDHQCNEKNYAIIGYELANTLSEHGTVSRGVCQLDGKNNLVSINERTKIFRENDRIVYLENEVGHEVPPDSSVSMNFWCFHPSIFTATRQLFHEFLTTNLKHPGSEFFIPIIAEKFIDRGGTIKVIPCSSQWFGITYKEDATGVKDSIAKLIGVGEYPASLW